MDGKTLRKLMVLRYNWLHDVFELAEKNAEKAADIWERFIIAELNVYDILPLFEAFKLLDDRNEKNDTV